MLTDELMREVRRLQVRTRRRVEGLFAGRYHSAFKGRGIEFSEVREYEPGDDVRAIDWNVTARTGRPFIKRFVEERELTVVLAVDISASEAFGSAGRPKRRLAAEAAAVIALSAARNNDRVGLLLFSDHAELYVPPRKGRTHLLRVLRELLSFEPRGRGTDLAGAADVLGGVLTRRALVFVVSDFLASGWETRMRVLRRRHEVIALTLSDPRERSLPKAGLVEVTDPETGARAVVDCASRAARAGFERAWQESEAAVRTALDRARVGRIALSTDEPFVPALIAYFTARERRRHA
ncbi:MAG: DUF58 domain-containing protein [Phycisphaerae bacterium]|nr:DUF58 domain-containing protein [Phycisphaerae bacterium]